MASRRFALALAVAAVGLPGCGDDSGGDQLSAAEYRERANRICREARRDARGLERAGLQTQLERSADAAAQFQKRFEQLEPPDELREKHDVAVRRGREAIEVLRRAERALEEEGGAIGLVGLADDLDRVVNQGNAAARDLGLDDCVTDAA